MSFLPYERSAPSRWYAASAVSVVLHGLLLAIAWGGIQQMYTVPPRITAPPEVKVTLERLHSDTLAGNVLQGGMAGARPDTAPDPTQADLDRLSADTAEHDRPLASAEPVDTATVTETVEPSVAPTLEQAIPVPVVTSQALEPLSQDLPAPPQPEVQGPTQNSATVIGGTAVSVAPLVAEALDPIIPLGAAPVAAVPLEGQALTSVLTGVKASETRELTAVSAQNRAIAARALPPHEAISARGIAARPGRAVSEIGDTTRPAPGKQDLAVADLIRKIRATPADPCLLALPRRDGSDGVGLALISGADLAMTRFSDSALGPDDSEIRQTRTLVDPRQCPALTVLRKNRDYPSTRLALRLDGAEVTSGETLSGDLAGVAGRYVLLLLVDNNGVVQDLQRFMTFSGNAAHFAVPVTRAGPARDTAQLLIAVATTRPATQIRAEIGQLAQDVFSGVDPEITRNAAVAVTTFDVR